MNETKKTDIAIFECQRELLAAIDRYENLFSTEQPMSENRRIDVTNLRGIIDNPEEAYQTLEDLLNAVMAYMKDIFTGLKIFGYWIYKSDFSRLREYYVMPVINDYKNPRLRKIVHLYNQHLETNTHQAPERSPTFGDIQLIELDKEVVPERREQTISGCGNFQQSQPHEKAEPGPFNSLKFSDESEEIAYAIQLSMMENHLSDSGKLEEQGKPHAGGFVERNKIQEKSEEIISRNEKGKAKESQPINIAFNEASRSFLKEDTRETARTCKEKSSAPGGFWKITEKISLTFDEKLRKRQKRASYLIDSGKHTRRQVRDYLLFEDDALEKDAVSQRIFRGSYSP